MKINFEKVLLIFIFLYPITPWYITIGPLNLVNIISLCFILLWILNSNFKISRFKGSAPFFWIYLVSYSIQAIFDTSLLTAFAYIISQLVISIILFGEIRKRQLLDKAIEMIIYAAGVETIIGLIEEIFRINVFHILSGLPDSTFYQETRLGIFRIMSSFSHPIVYGAYLCLAAGLAVYAINKECNRKRKRIFKLIYFLILLNSILTMSRSTLLVLIVEQVIFGYATGFLRFSKKIIGILGIAIICLIFASALNLPIMSKLQNIWYMFMALFDDHYTSLYTVSFGMNENAIGNRTDLYTWVADAVTGHELFGMGTSAEFSYEVNAVEKTWYTSYTWTKTSIENEYLFNYYIHGAVGLTFFVLNIINSIIYSVKVFIKEKKSKYIEKLNFPFVILILLLGYAFTLFSVRSSDNVRLFNVIMCLLFGYSCNKYWRLEHEK